MICDLSTNLFVIIVLLIYQVQLFHELVQWTEPPPPGDAPALTRLLKWQSITVNNPFVTNRSVFDVPLDLYQNQSSPVKDLLKVYVYDLERDVPSSYARDVFEWFRLEGMNSHYATDYVLINLFRSFPGRTLDPTEADIFVVPYPHLGHCMTDQGYELYCQQVNETEVETTIKERLPYYNETSKDRHLFFMSEFEMLAHRWISNQPLLVTYGPLWEHASGKRGRRPKKYRSPKGHILVPQFNSDLKFQPFFVEKQFKEQKQKQKQLEQTRTPNVRDLSLVFAASDKNERMRTTPKIFRGYLTRLLERMMNTTSSTAAVTTKDGASPPGTIGGLPFVGSSRVQYFAIGVDSSANATTKIDLYDLYRRSIFCPILPGDVAWQRRFFDVMACGCLPVVVSYPLRTQTFKNHKKHYSSSTTNVRLPVSWYIPEGGAHTFKDAWSVQETYPFVDQIDYLKFVVESPGNETYPETTATNLIETLEGLFKERNIIRHKQEALHQAVNGVLYGVGPDAHQTDDAFAHLIRALRHYVDTMP